MHLVTANSSFPQSQLRSCSRSAHATLLEKVSYVPGSICKSALGKGCLRADSSALTHILLPRPPACRHARSDTRVPPGCASSTASVHARSLLSLCQARRSCKSLSVITRTCCLFLQHSPSKQQDFYCPISSSSYYLKNDSLGERRLPQ